MESRLTNETTTFFGNIRKRFTDELWNGLHHVLQISEETTNLSDLSKYVDTALERIAQLKILDSVSLQASSSAGDLQREWETNQMRVDHMRMVADALFYLSEDIKMWAVPQFEVLTSLHILTEGQLTFMPSVLDELLPPKPLNSIVSANMLCSVTNEVLSLIEGVKVPHGIQVVCVEQGVATLVSDNEFQVKVTLTRAPPEVVGNLHDLEKQVGELDHDITVKEDINDSESIESEIPSFHVHIPDGKFEEVVEVDRQWWWSLVELELFPRSHEGSRFLEDFQVEYLRMEFDSRMINLATSIVANRRLKLERKLGKHSTQKTSTTASQNSSLSAARTDIARQENEDYGNEANEDQIKPLELLMDMCRDTSSRLILSAFRMSMKQLIASNSPFRETCRLAVAKRLSPGLRLCYWSGVPVITDKTVKGALDVSRVRMIQPFLEIGVNDKGCIGICSFPLPPEIYECHKPALELNVKYPNVKELVTKSALYLSFPIIDLLLKEITKHSLDVENFPVKFEFVTIQECQPCESQVVLSCASLQENLSLKSPSIKCSAESRSILAVSVSLITGNLQLELLVADDSYFKSRMPQWEEWLNRLWRTTAKTPTKDGVHPHIAALAPVANAVIQILRNLLQTRETSSATFSDFLLEFGTPFVIGDRLAQDFQMKIKNSFIDLSRTTNFLLRKTRYELNLQNRNQLFNFHFLLSFDGYEKKAVLTILKCDEKNVANEILDVVLIPKRIIDGTESIVVKDRKRKKDQSESIVHTKRGRLNEIGDSEFELTALLAFPEDRGSSSIGKIQESNTVELTEVLLNWCRARIMFESFKETLKVLKINFEEEYSLDQSKDVCYRIRLKDWKNVNCPWVARKAPIATVLDDASLNFGFEGLEGLCIEICNGTVWRLLIRSKQLKESISKREQLELSEKQIEALNQKKGHYQQVEVTNHSVILTYLASQTFNVMVADLVAISTQQMFLNNLLEAGCEIGAERSSGIDALMTIIKADLMQTILLLKRKSKDESEKWRVYYVLGWKKLEHSESELSSLFSGTTLTRDLQETSDSLNKMTLESPSGSKKRRKQREVPYAKKRMTEGSPSCDISSHFDPHRVQELQKKHGMRCQIHCSIPVPEIYLQCLEGLLLSGKMQDCLSSMSTISGSLFHMQDLWTRLMQSSDWRFHILPQSTESGFDFLCRAASDIEYTMPLRFLDEGYAFIRLFDMTDVVREKPLCREFCPVEDITKTILNVLSKFAPTSS